MQMIAVVIAKVLGVLLMLAAFWVWISYDYPNVSPFAFGAPLAPGMFGQVLNWVVVCILGAGGWFLFTLGRKDKKADDPNDPGAKGI